jgi:hypothetical protein
MITSRVNAAVQPRFTLRFTPSFTPLVVPSASPRLSCAGVWNGEIPHSGSGMRRERPRLLDGFAATSLVLAPIVAVAGRSRRIPAKCQWKETQ